MPAMLLGEFYNTHAHTFSELTEHTEGRTGDLLLTLTFGNPSMSPDPASGNGERINKSILWD